MNELVRVGFCKKTYGVKGEVKIQIEEEYLADFLRSEVVFVEIAGKHIPHFVEYIRTGSNLLIKFEDVDSPEAAVAITGKEVFMRAGDLSFAAEEAVGYEELVGFKILDETLGEIGTIEEIVEMPEQYLAVLNYADKEVMIPLHEDLIVALDVEREIITMNLPEGLFEL